MAKAYAKKPAARSKYDKEVMAVDERVNISYMVYNGSFFRFFPLPNDANNTWFSDSQKNVGFSGDDSLFVYSILPIYYQAIQQALNDGDFEVTDKTLEAIKKYQTKFGAEVLPSNLKLKTEVFYNQSRVFNHLSYFYALTGVLMLFLLIMQVLKEQKWRDILIKFCFVLISFAFLVHTLGLASRWFVSGMHLGVMLTKA